MDVFAKFDEILSMILQDIKETKRYGYTVGLSFGRTEGRTDNVKTVYPPTNIVCGGIITMMGWSPRCYIPSFVEIGPLVPEKLFTIYDHGGPLGCVTQMPQTKIFFRPKKGDHIKFGFDWPSGFIGEDL